MYRALVLESARRAWVLDPVAPFSIWMYIREATIAYWSDVYSLIGYLPSLAKKEF
jgi:hypothetical protein